METFLHCPKLILTKSIFNKARSDQNSYHSLYLQLETIDQGVRKTKEVVEAMTKRTMDLVTPLEFIETKMPLEMRKLFYVLPQDLYFTLPTAAVL